MGLSKYLYCLTHPAPSFVGFKYFVPRTCPLRGLVMCPMLQACCCRQGRALRAGTCVQAGQWAAENSPCSAAPPWRRCLCAQWVPNIDCLMAMCLLCLKLSKSEVSFKYIRYTKTQEFGMFAYPFHGVSLLSDWQPNPVSLKQK